MVRVTFKGPKTFVANCDRVSSGLISNTIRHATSRQEWEVKTRKAPVSREVKTLLREFFQPSGLAVACVVDQVVNPPVDVVCLLGSVSILPRAR